ncbi:MAG TPA: copper resistance CopC family protein [Gemmatimonadales bacterium]
MALGALVALTTTSAGAVLHNRLTKSAPAKDEVLAGPPTAIQLWFSEPTEPALSGITLLGPGRTKVVLAKVHKTDDPRSIVADIKDSTPIGVYTVDWRASGRDGHVIRGSYRFTIDP